MRTDSTRSNSKVHKEDSSLMNAFQKRNFKLLAGTQRTRIPVSNNMKGGKRVSATESLLLLKSQTIFPSQAIKRYIPINSRSTKNDVFVQSITSDGILINNIRIASIRYARKFSAAVKTSSASFNELFAFSVVYRPPTAICLFRQATVNLMIIFQTSVRQVEQASTSYSSAV